MTDNQAYHKGDVMNALGDEVQRMVEERKKMMDPNHRNDDTDSEEMSSDDENLKSGDISFISAIDVGSHFIEVNPHDELKFQNFEGNLIA